MIIYMSLGDKICKTIEVDCIKEDFPEIKLNGQNSISLYGRKKREQMYIEGNAEGLFIYADVKRCIIQKDAKICRLTVDSCEVVEIFGEIEEMTIDVSSKIILQKGSMVKKIIIEYKSLHLYPNKFQSMSIEGDIDGNIEINPRCLCDLSINGTINGNLDINLVNMCRVKIQGNIYGSLNVKDSIKCKLVKNDNPSRFLGEIESKWKTYYNNTNLVIDKSAYVKKISSVIMDLYIYGRVSEIKCDRINNVFIDSDAKLDAPMIDSSVMGCIYVIGDSSKKSDMYNGLVSANVEYIDENGFKIKNNCKLLSESELSKMQFVNNDRSREIAFNEGDLLEINEHINGDLRIYGNSKGSIIINAHIRGKLILCGFERLNLLKITEKCIVRDGIVIDSCKMRRMDYSGQIRFGGIEFNDFCVCDLIDINSNVGGDIISCSVRHRDSMTGNLRINKDVKVNNICGGFNNVLIYGYVDKIESNCGTIDRIVIYDTAELGDKRIGYNIKNVYIENCELMTELIENRKTLPVVKKLSKAEIRKISGYVHMEPKINLWPLSELNSKIIDEIINCKVTYIGPESTLLKSENLRGNSDNDNSINDKGKPNDNEIKPNNDETKPNNSQAKLNNDKTKLNDDKTKQNDNEIKFSPFVNKWNIWGMYLLWTGLVCFLIVLISEFNKSYFVKNKSIVDVKL